MDAIFELEIVPANADGTFSARVLRSVGGGEPTAEFHLDVDGLLQQRPLFEATVLSSAVSARRVISTTETTVQQVGVRLFEAVFTGAIGGAYRTSSALAQERGTGLKLVLRLTPELAALPWESLYDAEAGAYLSRQEPLVRTVPANFTAEPLAIDPPLRLLGIVSAPRDLQRLDAAAERSRLEDALRPQIQAGLVELVWLEDVTWNGLHAMLLSEPWHVLHFVGHGGFDVTTEEGQLALTTEDGRADFVSASSLADLLREAEPTPRLVVLNSCDSGAVSEDDLFSGTAAALVRSGINAVAAMQFAISDGAAISFARGFYTALARGRKVDEAVRSGRIGILGMGRGTLEWLTPVLYLRGDDTRLFDIVSAPTAVPVALSAPAGEAPPAEVVEPGVEVVEPEVAEAAGAPKEIPATEAPAPEASGPEEPAPEAAPPPEASDADRSESIVPPQTPPDDGGPDDSSADGGSEDEAAVQRRRRRIAIAVGAGAAVVALIGFIIWGFAAFRGSTGGTASKSTGDDTVQTDGPTPTPEPPLPPVTAQVSVPGNAQWTPTQFTCAAGDRLDIVADGTVNHDGTPESAVGPSGLTGVGNHQWNLPGLPDENTVGLVGRVADVQPSFFVGSEFHGVCPSDGVLSLGVNDAFVEANTGAFLATVTHSPVDSVTAALTTVVPSTSTWSGTPVTCTAGDTLWFTASGAVQHGPTEDRTSGPDGTADYDPAWNVAGLEDANHASLIGRLDGETPFVVGTASRVECPTDGRLELGINDDGDDIAQNAGDFTVSVVTDRIG
jgi:hypothetical protein